MSTAQGAVLLTRRGLREATLTVPPDALRDVAPGTEVLWQVDVVHADGTRERSATFSVTLR